MPSTTLLHNVGHSVDPPRVGAYQSRLMERYLGFLAKREKPRILDIGPIVGRNISFLLEQGVRLNVCDIMSRLGRASQNIQPENLRPLFDYQEAGFDAVHVWDIPDHLYQSSLDELVRLCTRVLRPDGMLMTITSSSTSVQPFQHYFTINDRANVTLQRIEQNKLPYYYRSNRDIDAAMKPLEQLCSFVCMNGLREFLFKKPF
jgi:2-polyprenyl-3-methyl-5-hydroxy-6-metoxy-1,4-benzoquinol methylase